MQDAMTHKWITERIITKKRRALSRTLEPLIRSVLADDWLGNASNDIITTIYSSFVLHSKTMVPILSNQFVYCECRDYRSATPLSSIGGILLDPYKLYY